MHRDEYETLVKRFALELSDIGVSKELLEIVQAKYDRTPNIISVSGEDTTGHFIYQNSGYRIEVKKTISLVIKKFIRYLLWGLCCYLQ